MVILLAGNILMIAVSIVALFLVTMALVLLLLVAKKKLMPDGTVTISINGGEKTLEVDMGSSLLTTLSNNKVFLPSACGGVGTCGQCSCQVTAGGGGHTSYRSRFFYP
jgi:Na+-transporting NADH:ubiquinone oxidoreductase subunit F